VLRFDGEFGRFTFAELISVPQLLEQVEAEIPAQRLFDHLTIALARSGGTDLHPAQDVLVDSEGGPHLCHQRIIASVRHCAAAPRTEARAGRSNPARPKNLLSPGARRLDHGVAVGTLVNELRPAETEDSASRHARRRPTNATGPQVRAFLRAELGIPTHDLLHGKQ
jgi:hypothetical protein